MKTKRCPNCKHNKPLDEFYKDSSKVNGHMSHCKLCDIAYKLGRNIIIRLAVDHNHNANEIRGLLCRNCNLGLGLFRDSIIQFQSAINYLRNYSTKGKDMSEFTEGIMMDIDKLKEFRSACGFTYMPRNIPQEAIDLLKQQGITLFSLCEVGELPNEKLIGYFSVQRIPLDIAKKFVDICKEKTGASFRAEEYGILPNERTGFESE